MKFQPRAYQSLIIEHILRTPRCAVWAGMGMGKTVSTLTAIQYLQVLDGEGPALVIAPIRVARTSWTDEAEKWEHLGRLTVETFCTTPAKRLALVERIRAGSIPDVCTINYELLPWLVGAFPEDTWPFRIVVADEATRLKSFKLRSGSVRAKALASVQSHVRRFIELTGTPAPNGLLDLWGQFWFLDQGKRIGRSLQAYKERWFRPRQVGSDAFAVRWDPLPGSDADIHQRVSDLVVRVNAEDWFDLRQPIVSDVRVRLEGKAAETYHGMERHFEAELDGGRVEAANAAAKTGKLLQIASGAAYLPAEGGKAPRWEEIHTAKMDALTSIVEEAAGAPILVAYQFRHDLERILKRFPSARQLDKDPKTIRDWNAGRIPMLVAHPASCGHGLSLQDGGNILVFFSTGWNLEEHDQMVERIGPTRQAQSGHERPVFIYNIIAEGTVDETVQERIATKRDVMDLLLERRNRHA